MFGDRPFGGNVLRAVAFRRQLFGGGVCGGGKDFFRRGTFCDGLAGGCFGRLGNGVAARAWPTGAIAGLLAKRGEGLDLGLHFDVGVFSLHLGRFGLCRFGFGFRRLGFGFGYLGFDFRRLGFGFGHRHFCRSNGFGIATGFSFRCRRFGHRLGCLGFGCRRLGFGSGLFGFGLGLFGLRRVLGSGGFRLGCRRAR